MIYTIEVNSSLDLAAGLMAAHGIHHLVVTDHGKVIGVLADADVYRVSLAATKDDGWQGIVGEAYCPIFPMPDEVG